MATPLAPPPPVGQEIDSRQFRDWFYSLYALLGQPGSTLGTMAYQNADSVAITGGALGGVGISGSTVNNTPIGQTFAAAGRFTNLQADGTVSGNGFTNYFASPPPLGSTTPNRVNTNALKTTALTGYLYGNGTSSDVTASTTIPWSAITGAPSITSPSYGAFQNNADQTFSSANTPAIIVLNTTDYSRNVTLTSNRITTSVAGMYNLEFSFQLASSDTSIHEFDVWLRKNGTDVSGTSSTCSVPNRHGSIDGYIIMAANFYIQLAAGDYVELWSAVNNTNIRINAIPAQTTPYTKPYSPSSVITLTQIA
jgi:hypothetical protein